MQQITNDQELRAALDKLSIDQQRALGARFVANVGGMINDPRLAKALDIAMEPDNTPQDREDAYKVAKSIATKSYTACGQDVDWQAQAEHFVAAACSVVLTPDNLKSELSNIAWKAAIHSRMAENCLMMENEESDAEGQAQLQYEIAEEFLNN